MPERTDICSRKIFDVQDGKMVWQSEGDYLCVHMTKIQGKKRTFVLMFFRVCDTGCPVEQLELNEPIVSATWEPTGDRICIVHGESRNPIVSFYSMSGTSTKLATKGKKELTFLFSTKDLSCNNISWSPSGEVCAIVFYAPDVCTFHLYDVENNVLLATRKHDRGNRLVWDPSGRLVASCTISALKQDRVVRGHPDDGFILYTFQGNLVAQIRKEKLYQFEWRPRPADLMTAEEKKKVIKNLKKYEKVFEKEDKARKQVLSQELLENRRRLAEDFYSILRKNKDLNSKLKSKRIAARRGWDDDNVKNFNYEVSVRNYYHYYTCIYLLF
jgi:translation initiation factor 3 subunit B